MFPLGSVLFPGVALPLHVFEPRFRLMMNECLTEEREFGIVLIARGSEVGGGDQRHGVGTRARVAHVEALEDGRLLVVATGVGRFQVDEWLPDDPYPVAMVSDLGDDEPSSDDVRSAEAAVRRFRALLSEYADVEVLPEGFALDPDPTVRSWQLCALGATNPLDGQSLLATDDPALRLRLLADLCESGAQDVLALLSEGDDFPSLDD